jgi:hypothetical protein
MGIRSSVSALLHPYLQVIESFIPLQDPRVNLEWLAVQLQVSVKYHNLVVCLVY